MVDACGEAKHFVGDGGYRGWDGGPEFPDQKILGASALIFARANLPKLCDFIRQV
jgi:hypothetical protein